MDEKELISEFQKKIRQIFHLYRDFFMGEMYRRSAE